jgi:hypothetical protein
MFIADPHPATNVLATQITLGLLASGLLRWVKKAPFLKMINDNSSTLNHLFLLVTSAVGALGVHSAWSASTHSLTITGLDPVSIGASLWLWAKQWSIQFLVHKGAFGPVSTPALPAEVKS